MAEGLQQACIVIPALDAERTIARVIADVTSTIPELHASILVVDDGSRDETARIARDAGAIVLPSAGADGPPRNLGKGAALRAGFEAARARGHAIAVTVDADGQHPAREARRLLLVRGARPATDTLVLGIRDLVRDGAPRANVMSNGISNWFLSRFAGRELRDTQCGLRRYPIDRTLALGARGNGYDFEAELLLRAVWAGMEILEEPVDVVYPEDRETHFHPARDPWRIVRTIVGALGDRWLGPAVKPQDEET